MQVEIEVEDDGRYIAEVPAIPGALAYGFTSREAVIKVKSLVLRILAERIESGEDCPEINEVFTVTT